ncbi:hypothetical protein LTR36_009990 [Oleoguttula mirabilis]|uniref:C2H2-type domain-containing protein n=1 Tax=Oleoguttula mirabilis TaxID=1507867 RepID=A0AAV9JSX2_9PEZI|nr:hypothetical protein LTR36_009990 [Oleoguttula mirabilis]
MENRRSAELQKTANDFLRGALWQHRANVNDIAEEVIKLIIGNDQNPLTDLIEARYHVLSRPDPPAPPKPQTSKLSFRFSRNRDRDRQQPKAADNTSKPTSSSESRVDRCQQEFQSVFQADVAFAADRRTSLAQPLQPSTGLGKERLLDVTPGSPEHSKAPAAALATYSCCFCQTGYSVKGTCKRHLEEIHVAKKYYQCEMCRHKSPTVPEAKKHANACSVGLLGWTTVKPSNRQIYSSEFADQLFSTQQQYIDHLVVLCALPKAERPRMSYHTKLRNLLGQRLFEAALHCLSCRLFGGPEAWRGVRWEHKRIQTAVWELEHGKPEHDLAGHDLIGIHKVKTFLDELFADRLSSPEASAKLDYVASPINNGGPPGTGPLPRRSSSTGFAAQDQSTVTSGPQMAAISQEPNNVQVHYFGNGRKVTGMEPTSKRPLSYETATKVPVRQPPGPPTGGLSAPSRAGTVTAKAQVMTLPSNNFFDTTSHGTSAPAWNYAEQPPPYDTSLMTGLSYMDPSVELFSAGSLVHDTLLGVNEHSMDFAGNDKFTPYGPQDSDMLDFYPQSMQRSHEQTADSHIGGSRHTLPYQPVGSATTHDVSGDIHTRNQSFWFDAPDTGHDGSAPDLNILR